MTDSTQDPKEARQVQHSHDPEELETLYHDEDPEIEADEFGPRPGRSLPRRRAVRRPPPRKRYYEE